MFININGKKSYAPSPLPYHARVCTLLPLYYTQIQINTYIPIRLPPQVFIPHALLSLLILHVLVGYYSWLPVFLLLYYHYRWSLVSIADILSAVGYPIRPNFIHFWRLPGLQ